MNKFLYIFVLVLRFISAPLIFFWPWISVIVSFLLDIVDIEFASQGVTTLKEYEIIDKVFDLWWYIMSIAYSFFRLRQWFVFLLVLFLYRLVGDFIFFLKGERKILLFFPNFFENAFFLFFFSSYFSGLNFLISPNYLYWSLALIFAIKIFQEWWIHWAQISIPEDFLGKKRKWRVYNK